MKFGREVLLLAILLSVVLADNNYHHATDRHENQKVSNSTLHKIWKRENRCLKDEYSAGAHCCKFCNAGTYAHSDCTEEHGNPKCQDCTEGVDYMDEKNGLHMCHKCFQCDPHLGQREEEPCTVLQNTVCKCSKNFFCAENKMDKSAGCTKCQHCTLCENGYAEICTDTKDATCKSKRNRHALIAALVGVSILFLCCVCYACRLKKKRINRPPQSHPQPPEPPIPDKLKVEDIDLTELLTFFSDTMEHSTVVWLVRQMGLPDPRIEAIQLEYQSQINEQKYQLLKAWYEGHGINGAFQKLIRTLEKNNKRRIAEKLIQIARSHRQQIQD